VQTSSALRRASSFLRLGPDNRTGRIWLLPELPTREGRVALLHKRTVSPLPPFPGPPSASGMLQAPVQGQRGMAVSVEGDRQIKRQPWPTPQQLDGPAGARPSRAASLHLCGPVQSLLLPPPPRWQWRRRLHRELPLPQAGTVSETKRVPLGPTERIAGGPFGLAFTGGGALPGLAATGGAAAGFSSVPDGSALAAKRRAQSPVGSRVSIVSQREAAGEAAGDEAAGERSKQRRFPYPWPPVAPRRASA
jgi:hypothetical protein